jgi:serine/threonine protein kinase
VGALVGNYRILGKLGEGGMGAVYLAEHTIIERKVALKVLLPELSHDPESLSRFFNEAKAAARLQHPGLISVHDFGHLPSGSAYLVMEHLEGETLAARLWREKSLALPLVLEIARQLAGALGAAHDQGIIHRDLKPENIFLVPAPDRPEGLRVKVLDFGIAKLVREDSPGSFKTSTGIILGTPTYMSPEQCRGITPLDHRTDIYSLGCILYEMISGQPPFDGEGPGDVLAAHIHVKPRALRKLVPSVPLPLERIILKAMAKRPDARHQRMAELLDDLAILVEVQHAQHGGTGPTPELSVAADADPSEAEPSGDHLPGLPIDETPEFVEMPQFEETPPLPRRRRSVGVWPWEAWRAWRARGTRTFAMSLGAAVLFGTIAIAAWRSGRSGGTPSDKDASPPPALPGVVRAEQQPSLTSTSVPAPLAQGQPSRLRIESQPSGAAVVRVADGRMLGTTPLELSAPQAAGSALLLRLAGHRDEWVEPARNRTGQLRVEFEPLPGRRAATARKRVPTSGPVVRRVGDGALNPFEHGPPVRRASKPAPSAAGSLEHRRAGVGAKPHR